MKKELLKKAAKASMTTAQKGLHHCQETKQMLAENQVRWQKANEKYQRALSRVMVILEKSQELLSLCRRYGLTEEELPFPVGSLQKMFPDVTLKQDGSFLFKGAAAGTAAVTSALGGTALFGTASTGAAISGLHGAAATGAVLANLGGGSLAAGGLGIAGGVAALGATFALPAVAVGGYLWDKSVREQHQKVVAYENAVEKECQVLEKIYQRYDGLNRNLIEWLTCKQSQTFLDK